MGKNTDALNRAEKERSLRKQGSAAISQKNELSDYGIIGKKGLKNSLLIWFFSAAVLITVLLAFNKQGSQKIPLSEIFPEQEVFPVEVEYEFVGQEVVNQEEQAEAKEAVVIAKKQVVNIVEENKVAKEEAKEVVFKKPVLEQPAGVFYAVQVASFKDSSRAKQDVENLTKKGYKAYSLPANLGSKGTWHRVYIGKFDTKNSAMLFLQEIKKDFADSFIRKIQ
ncbi:MAG: SPOR domain-containing protein [Candidatus Omnitrophica bacterium]|nr:SPOR domain-containing protein [Candidatus Omnitrophota bacterium]MBU1996907.1 SPOR domain-containing protein [Candidatus Omnitrophota bacterium]MBU4333422.1 SPOR domain-containing protein [Candidatus Omnitrophota bacterium]